MTDIQARDYLMIINGNNPQINELYLKGRILGSYKSTMDHDYDYQPAVDVEMASFRTHLVWFAMARNIQQPLQPLTD